MIRLRSLLLLAFFGWVLLAPTARVLAQTPEPWQQAETARSALVAAQAALLGQNQAEAKAQLAQAQTAVTALAEQLAPLAPEAAKSLQAHTIALGTPAEFAAARATLWTKVLLAGMQGTQAAITQNNPDAAQAWLRVRAFRTATRLTSASTDATKALSDWRAGTISAEQAAKAVQADLLDTYQANTRDALSALTATTKRENASAAAEQAALAQGYFAIVRESYAQQRGTEQADLLASQFTKLTTAAVAADWPTVTSTQQTLLEGLRGFTTTPLNDDDVARKAQQIYQFINLLQIEYAKGIRNGVVTVPLEVQEAQTFQRQATALLDELTPSFSARDAQATTTLGTQLREIGMLIEQTADPAEVTSRAKQIMDLLSGPLGVSDQGGDITAALELLKQLRSEIAAGEYATAEATRLQAYGLFEIGAEQKLQTRDGELGSEMEALFWQGTSDQPGLAVLVQGKAKPEAIEPVIARLEADLNKAQEILGDKMTPTGAILAGVAVLVREGLEAVLVIGAILGYMRATKAPSSAPRSVLGGALIGVVLSFGLWGLAQTVLTVSPSHRELFEGVIALIAAAMLVYVTNWLLHKTYVVDWVAFVRQQVQQAMGRGSIFGLALLGFMVVAREGFETVLFIQALTFDAPGWAVAVGVVIGMAINLVVALVILRFSVRLPLKPFFTITSALLLILALSFVGNGLRNLQEAGIIGVHRLDGIPLGTIPALFGLFPTIETVVGQVLVLVLLVSTFLIARARGQRTAAAPGAPRPAQ